MASAPAPTEPGDAPERPAGRAGASPLPRSIGASSAARRVINTVQLPGRLASTTRRLSRQLGLGLGARETARTLPTRAMQVRFPDGVWAMGQQADDRAGVGGPAIDPSLAAIMARYNQRSKATAAPPARRGLPYALRRRHVTSSGVGTGPTAVAARTRPADARVPRNDGHGPDAFAPRPRSSRTRRPSSHDDPAPGATTRGPAPGAPARHPSAFRPLLPLSPAGEAADHLLAASPPAPTRSTLAAARFRPTARPLARSGGVPSASLSASSAVVSRLPRTITAVPPPRAAATGTVPRAAGRTPAGAPPARPGTPAVPAGAATVSAPPAGSSAALWAERLAAVFGGPPPGAAPPGAAPAVAATSTFAAIASRSPWPDASPAGERASSWSAGAPEHRATVVSRSPEAPRLRADAMWRATTAGALVRPPRFIVAPNDGPIEGAATPAVGPTSAARRGERATPAIDHAPSARPRSSTADRRSTSLVHAGSTRPAVARRDAGTPAPAFAAGAERPARPGATDAAGPRTLDRRHAFQPTSTDDARRMQATDGRPAEAPPAIARGGGDRPAGVSTASPIAFARRALDHARGRLLAGRDRTGESVALPFDVRRAPVASGAVPVSTNTAGAVATSAVGPLAAPRLAPGTRTPSGVAVQGGGHALRRVSDATISTRSGAVAAPARVAAPAWGRAVPGRAPSRPARWDRRAELARAVAAPSTIAVGVTASAAAMRSPMLAAPTNAAPAATTPAATTPAATTPAAGTQPIVARAALGSFPTAYARGASGSLAAATTHQAERRVARRGHDAGGGDWIGTAVHATSPFAVRRQATADARSTSAVPTVGRPLPQSYRGLAAALGNRHPVHVRHDAGARDALRRAGVPAATVGNTILLDRAPTLDPAMRERIGHELVHTAAGGSTPRLFGDPQHDHEEAHARRVGRLARQLAPEAVAGAIALPSTRTIVPGAPGNVGTGELAVTPPARPTAVAMPDGSVRRSPAAPSVPASATAPPSAAPQAAAASADATAPTRRTSVSRTSTRRSGAVRRAAATTATVARSAAAAEVMQRLAAGPAASPAPASAPAPTAGAATGRVTPEAAANGRKRPTATERLDDLDELVAMVEARVIAELERRGGRHRAWM